MCLGIVTAIVLVGAATIALAAEPSGTTQAGKSSAVELTADDVIVNPLPSPCTNPETGEVVGQHCFEEHLAPGIDERSVDRAQELSIELSKECGLLGDGAQDNPFCTHPETYTDGVRRLDAMRAAIESRSQPND